MKSGSTLCGTPAQDLELVAACSLPTQWAPFSRFSGFLCRILQAHQLYTLVCACTLTTWHNYMQIALQKKFKSASKRQHTLKTFLLWISNQGRQARVDEIVILSDEAICFRDILTRNSFLNAIAIVNVLGGSTNAVRKVYIPSSVWFIDCCKCRFFTF